MTTPAKWDPEGKPKKPQIIGIGAQKAGTTWLSYILGQHPQVWTPPFKEAQFFNYRFISDHADWVPWHFKRSRQNTEKRYAAKGLPVPAELDAYYARITRGEMFTNHWYKQVFAPAPDGTAACDITPEYSTLPDEGVAFVAEFLPRAKFIYIIRHPVDRIVSQLKMNLTRKRRTPNGVEAWMKEIDDPVLYDRGDYAAYLPRWTSRFGPDRLMVIPFGAIAANPGALMRQVETHCELPPHSYSNLTNKVFAANKDLSVPPEVRAELRRRLEPQFQFIQETLGADFASRIR